MLEFVEEFVEHDTARSAEIRKEPLVSSGSEWHDLPHTRLSRAGQRQQNDTAVSRMRPTRHQPTPDQDAQRAADPSLVDPRQPADLVNCNALVMADIGKQTQLGERDAVMDPIYPARRTHQRVGEPGHPRSRQAFQDMEARIVSLDLQN